MNDVYNVGEIRALICANIHVCMFICVHMTRLAHCLICIKLSHFYHSYKRLCLLMFIPL